MKYILSFPLLLVLLAGCGGVADSPQACAFVPVTELPVTFGRGEPLVDVSINGEKAKMIFDAGSNRTMLTDAAYQRMHLPKDPVSRTFTVAFGGVSAHSNALIGDFELGAVKQSNMSVAVSDTPLLADQAVGLIGMDVLDKFDLDIDLPQGRVTLYQPRNCPSGQPNWNTGSESLPRPTLGRAAMASAIEVVLDGTKMNAILDTGASNYATTREAATAAGVTEAMLIADRQGHAQGAAKASATIAIHRFRTLKIGDEVILSPLMAVIRQDRGFGDGSFGVLIGSPYLRTHRVWISSDAFTVHTARPKP